MATCPQLGKADIAPPARDGPAGSQPTPDLLISDSAAGPVGQPLRPFHRRDALPRGTFNDGADGGDNAEEEEHCAYNRKKRSMGRACKK